MSKNCKRIQIDDLITDLDSLYDYIKSHEKLTGLSSHCGVNPNGIVANIVREATPYVDELTVDDIVDGDDLSNYTSITYRLACLKICDGKLFRCSNCGKVLPLKQLVYLYGRDKDSVVSLACSNKCRDMLCEKQIEKTKIKNKPYFAIKNVDDLKEYLKNNDMQGLLFYIDKNKDSELARILYKATEFLDTITENDIRKGDDIKDYQTPYYRMCVLIHPIFRCSVCNRLLPKKYFRYRYYEKENCYNTCSLECTQKIKHEETKARHAERDKDVLFNYIKDVDTLFSYFETHPHATVVSYCNKHPECDVAKIILKATSYLDDITEDDVVEGATVEEYKSFSYRCMNLRYHPQGLCRCVICGKLLPSGQLRKLANIDSFKRGGMVCSKKCFNKTEVSEETRQTMSEAGQNRWKNMSQEEIDELMAKVGETNEKRYGNRCSLHGEEQKRKKIETWKKKYGDDIEWVSQAKEVKEKIWDTNEERYGGKSPLCCKEQQDKRLKTWREKYGEDINWISESPEVIQKMVDTRKERNLTGGMSDEAWEHMVTNYDNPEIAKRYKNGEVYYFPESSRCITVQGYEREALNYFFLNNYSQDDIQAGRKFMSTFKFVYVMDGMNRRYIPDFYIESEKCFYEVKSTYTLLNQLDKNILKMKCVLDRGYDIKILVVETYDSERTKVKHIILDYDFIISKYEELVKTETGHDMPSFKQLFQNANYDVNYLDRYKNEKQMRIYHQSNCKLKLSIDSVSYELF